MKIAFFNFGKKNPRYFVTSESKEKSIVKKTNGVNFYELYSL